MNSFHTLFSFPPRLLMLMISLLLAGAPAWSAPIFNAALNNSNLTASLGWSSDLGPPLDNQTGPFVSNGSPVTISASAVRDGRSISGSITQTAPYVLKGEYWAADWTGVLNIPSPAFYGLFATASANGNWSFSIPGVAPPVVAATPFYYAAIWAIGAPDAIHPTFDVASVHPTTPLAAGSAVGTFRQQDFTSVGIPGFPSRPSFGAATFSLDSNAPASMTYSYRIAFSTTPIGVGVFDPPVSAVPEPSSFLLFAAGLALLALLRVRRYR
jgi:hypothetical protein